MTASNRSDRHQLVVVTGASTGMGAATARELAGRGYHVLAGVRRDVDADALRADGIEPHILDITDESDAAAIAYAVERAWLLISGGLHSLSLTEDGRQRLK